MRRLLMTSAVAAALAVGCGNEDTDQAVDRVQTQAEQAAGDATEQAEQAVGGLDTGEAVRRTEQALEDVTGSARELAEDPQADVDGRLADAERRARELSEQAGSELDQASPEVRSALGDANDRIAGAASDLQDATSAEEVQRVVQGELGQVGDRLRSAVGAGGADVPQDVRDRADRAREQLESLQRELPSP
jgi:uncharacterized protein YjbJ (UPF0337 family)